jgi:hypothetical protein
MPARNRHLPRHLSWPLTTTDVNDALGTHLIHVVGLRFLTRNGSGTMLGVEWVAPEPFNHGRGTHPNAVGFHIDVIPIASGERAAARAVLQARALPQLHEWITHALAADETWLQERHRRYWKVVEGHLTHYDEP